MRPPRASKVFLETIQVARHVGRLALRPIEKGIVQTAKASEELAFWTLRSQVVEGFIGRGRSKAVEDAYLQARDVVSESVFAMGHQSWKTGVQAVARAATQALRQVGAPARVIGPLDEHWNTLKVLRDLRSEQADQMEDALRLSPKRFVMIMREAERRKRRTQGKDPIEGYVQYMLSNGSLSRIGPMVLEKKIYTDLARIISFTFDRTLMRANRLSLWGHELHVTVAREHSTPLRIASRSTVGAAQVEAVVNLMMRSDDLKAPPLIQGAQRQLLTNCAVMILQLLEDLTSDRNMQFSILGHHFRVRLEPLAIEKLLHEQEVDNIPAQKFEVNARAIDELVDALIGEPEIQLVLVPDVVEAEIYRYALHRTICVLQFILAQLRIRLFGVEVRLGLASHENEADEEEVVQDYREIFVARPQLDAVLARLEDERSRVKKELRSRMQGVAAEETKALGLDTPHEFAALAAQDRLSRSLSVRRTVKIPIEKAYEIVADFDNYPAWMPLCTSARALPPDPQGHRCVEVGLGVQTGTVLGAIGDSVIYHVLLSEPAKPAKGPSARTARIVADAEDGFAYGKRLVYDWQFVANGENETDLRLDMFFQASRMFFLPLWDSVNAAITARVMKKLVSRAAELSAGAGASRGAGARNVAAAGGEAAGVADAGANGRR